MDGGLLLLCWLTLHRNLQSGWTYQAWKTIWKEGWEGQKKTRRFFLFFLLGELIIPQALLCLKCAPSSKLLHFFSSRLTSPQAPTVWVTNPTSFFSCYSTASILSLALLFPHPHRCSLLSFLLPSPLSSPLSLHCWLLTPTSSQPKSSSVPLTLIGL